MSCKYEQKRLISSLRVQPIIVILRLEEQQYNLLKTKNNLFSILKSLHDKGIKHIEIAWSDYLGWNDLIKEIKLSFPSIYLGSASVTSITALEAVAKAELKYATAPIWDPLLQSRANELGITLIPGIFSPTEFHQAIKFGCQIVKLFPASILGLNYLTQIIKPIKPVPFIIAAGGLTAKDINPWLKSGHDALILGKGLMKNNEIDPEILNWIDKNQEKISF